MHDLGKRYEMYPSPMTPKKISYPTLNLTSDQFPPLNGKSVGDICRLELTAHVTGMEQHNEDPASYTLEIRKAAPLHGKGKDAGREEYS